VALAKHPTLIAGFSPAEVDRLLPPTHRFDLELTVRATLREAVAELRATPFELVVARAGDDLAVVKLFVASARGPGSASTRAGILLVAPPARLDATSYLIGRGASKLLSTTESAEVVRCVVTGLVAAHSPLGERLVGRFAIRLQVSGEWCPWQTENLSASGMLLRGSGELKVNARIPFELDLPNATVVGEVKVMRRTSAEQDAVAGYGVRFSSFDGSGRQLLGQALSTLRRSG
jgi:hypothetical protein